MENVARNIETQYDWKTNLITLLISVFPDPYTLALNHQGWTWRDNLVHNKWVAIVGYDLATKTTKCSIESILMTKTELSKGPCKIKKNTRSKLEQVLNYMIKDFSPLNLDLKLDFIIWCYFVSIRNHMKSNHSYKLDKHEEFWAL